MCQSRKIENHGRSNEVHHKNLASVLLSLCTLPGRKFDSEEERKRVTDELITKRDYFRTLPDDTNYNPHRKDSSK